MELTRADYDCLSRPRHGTANPERMNNPLWEQTVRAGRTAYQVRQQFDDTGADMEAGVGSALSSYRDHPRGPVWSWQRFGRTTTQLPDGRVIHIAGEHEDWYDMDFCIYNDVLVQHADGRIDIYGYPKALFPPTDFHSATLLDGAILLLGSLGYKDLRRLGETQVLMLDTRTLAIQAITTGGESPGWISRHCAEAKSSGRVMVHGGKVQAIGADGKASYADNHGVFELDVTTWTWTRVGASPSSVELP